MGRVLSALLLFCLVDEAGQRMLAVTTPRPYVEGAAVLLPVVMPSNVIVPESEHALLQDMLERSRTFQRQCARIARAAPLRVIVRWTPSQVAGDSAVTVVIRRRDGGLAEAHVSLTLSRNVVELIAHEFEHVLEQLDGVDLAMMAARPQTGVRFDADTSRFETDRAIHAGRRVAAEVLGARR